MHVFAQDVLIRNTKAVQFNHYCMHTPVDLVCMYSSNWHWIMTTGTKFISASKFASLPMSCPCPTFQLTHKVLQAQSNAYLSSKEQF